LTTMGCNMTKKQELLKAAEEKLRSGVCNTIYEGFA
jgi:hypothetical protein